MKSAGVEDSKGYIESENRTTNTASPQQAMLAGDPEDGGGI
jgi:hypothetical protein